MSSSKPVGRNSSEYINWPGALTGAIMIALPFMGPWWEMRLGKFFEISLSPFHYKASFMGEVISIPLLNYLIPALQVLLFVGGICMIAGSLLRGERWHEYLSKFGFRKIFWPFLAFILSLVLCIFLINNFLIGAFPVASTGSFGSMQDNVEAEVPYLSGTGTVEVETEGFKTSVPIVLSLTPVFWLVLIVVALGIFSRKFYPRTVEKESFKQRKLKG